VVCRGYSQEINNSCLQSFSVEGDTAVWQFMAPAGMGKVLPLRVQIRMSAGRNHVSLAFTRNPAAGIPHGMDDDTPVKIILRPDIEDRMNHGKTKAFTGPETAWPKAVVSHPHGFEFVPDHGRRLKVMAHPGTFAPEPEWKYMVHHPFEATRGLDDSSDLFSPGYFTLTLTGGQSATLDAEICSGDEPSRTSAPDDKHTKSASHHSGVPLEEALRKAMQDFIVKRDDGKTIIAGYPWFLDWGRDTLICLRGLIAAGLLDDARRILRQFARFESRGTLPNMICGNDSSNRDTSDAPLWFFVACADLLQAEGKQDSLDLECGNRSLRQVLSSLATSYMEGTPNGVRMDAKSGLIFSPSHFTWMDTNHPAGSPREGYPIEIQALWYAALHLLAKIDPAPRWYELAGRVRASIQMHFTRNSCGYLSDCLHAARGQSAAEATPDDALRPNQLLAVTLDAVTDTELCSSILTACEELLIPGAIRSLADRPVKHLLPIFRSDRGLNDPAHPYWGAYEGDEDTRRKPAYHNGTAWTWLFPSYSEALTKTYGDKARETALALLTGSIEILNRECVGHIPEVLDGDSPHRLRGCGAQAWGATELYRVLAILTRIS
jgi:predicted glycogen debranching enzyme